MNRSKSSPRHRIVPLALLGALTLGSACKGDEPSKATDGKPTEPAPANGKDGSETPTPKVTPPTGPVANPVDSPAVAEAGDVIATVQLPTGTKMTDVAAVIDSMQPGASMMIAMQAPTMLDQAIGFEISKSAKLDAPISMLVLDPNSHPKPVALLVEATDVAALTEAAKAAGHAVEVRESLVLVGPAAVVEAGKEFAFANLTKTPDHTEIVVYPRKLASSFAGTIEQALAGMGPAMAGLGASGDGMAKMMKAYADGLLTVAEQTDRAVISVGTTGTSADFIVRVYPTAGSDFAGFVAAQVPTDHTLLGKLPSGAGTTMLMSGDLRSGPVRDKFVKFAVEVFGPMYAGLSAEEWLTLMQPWFDSLDGRYATSMTLDLEPASGGMGMKMHMLMGVTDSAKLVTSWREMLTKMSAGPAIEMMGMKITSEHQIKAIEHDGVEVDLYTSKVDASALPPDQAAAIAKAGTGNQAMYMTTFDDVAVMSTADADGQAIRTAIDAARGKAPTFELSPGMAGSIEASKQRGDSMFMYFDFSHIAAKAGQPASMPFKAMGMTFGRDGEALSLRMSLIK